MCLLLNFRPIEIDEKFENTRAVSSSAGLKLSLISSPNTFGSNKKFHFPCPANVRLRELYILQEAIEHWAHKNVRIKTLPKLNLSCQSCQVKKCVKGTRDCCNRACLTSMRFHPRHATLEFHACLVWRDESVAHIFSTARWTLQVSISSKENPRKSQKIWWLNLLNLRKNGKTTRVQHHLCTCHCHCWNICVYYAYLCFFVTFYYICIDVSSGQVYLLYNSA